MIVSNNCGEICEKKVDIFKRLRGLIRLKSTKWGETVEMHAIVNNDLLEMYSIKNFPQLLFYRSGRYITYTG